MNASPQISLDFGLIGVLAATLIALLFLAVMSIICGQVIRKGSAATVGLVFLALLVFLGIGFARFNYGKVRITRHSKGFVESHSNGVSSRFEFDTLPSPLPVTEVLPEPAEEDVVWTSDSASAGSSSAASVGSWTREEDAVAASSTTPEISSETVFTEDAANVDLSRIDADRPDWVDELTGHWDSSKQKWIQTVQMGPYEDKEDILIHAYSDLHEAMKDFTMWHIAQIRMDNPEIPNHEPRFFPHVRYDSSRFIRKVRQTLKKDEQGGELISNMGKHVPEIYVTRANTSASEEPWPVVFARVELDTKVRDEIDRYARHSVSVNRAMKLGGIWGLALVAMACTLGGLKLFGGSSND